MRAYTNPVLQSQKMLASTVQFSTYDQTPPPRPRQTHGLPRETRRYENQDGPDTRFTEPHPVTRAMSALSGPNSVPTTGSTPTTPFPTPPEGDAVLGAAAAAGRTGQRSTLEHHPGDSRPSGTEEPSCPGAALHHPREREAVKCSLERR